MLLRTFVSPHRSYSTLSIASSRSSLASDLHDVGIPSPLPNNLNPETLAASTQDVPSASSSPQPPVAAESNEPQEVDPSYSSLPVPEINIQSEETVQSGAVEPESTETITVTENNQVSVHDVISSDDVNLPASGVDNTAGDMVDDSSLDVTLVNGNGLASSLKSDDTLTGSQELDPSSAEEAKDSSKTPIVEASNNSSTGESSLPLSETSDQLTHSSIAETLPHTELPHTTSEGVNSDTQLPVGTNAELGETTSNIPTLPEPDETVAQALSDDIQARVEVSPLKPNTDDHGEETNVSESTGRPHGESISSRKDNEPSSKSEKKDRFSIFRSASRTGKGTKRSGKKDKSKRSRGKRDERIIDDNQSEVSFQPDTDLSTKPRGSKKATSKCSLHCNVSIVFS